MTPNAAAMFLSSLALCGFADQIRNAHCVPCALVCFAWFCFVLTGQVIE